MPSFALRNITSMLVATAATLVCAAAPAAAFDGVANTGPGPNADTGFGHVDSGPTALADGKLGVPFDPTDDDPLEEAAAAALGSPNSPESDLGEALDRLAAAQNAEQARAAARLALDILEGNPIAKKAYSAIPLLNWNAPERVKTVPAGGTVTVRQVRWGEHMISDTALLRFDDPTLPFKIRYEVTEMGSAAGGELMPTPLLRNDDGTALGGQHAAIQPLALDNLETGTHQGSRFTRDRELADPGEQTRSATQEITVAMPPAGKIEAILDPNLRAGHETATALLPATPQRLGALGFDAQSTAAENKARAIGRLADASPEKQIWNALKALPDGDVGAANTAGTDLRGLVAAMRSRTELPAGESAEGADATVVLQNNEAYLNTRTLRLRANGSVTIKVINRDGFAHRMTALDLHNRDRIFGADDWGQFDWTERTLTGPDPLVPAGETRTFTVTPADGAFALWLGDLDAGDQAHVSIALERGIRQEALRFGASTVPVHSAPDADGNLWVTLAGVDTIAKVTPSANLESSTVQRFPLPGGRHELDSPLPPLTPSDITVDGRGIVWATLASANAIARIDPARARDGTTDAITLLQLDNCAGAQVECQPEVPPVPNEQPTRRPTRIKSMIDGQGHTVLWFVEAGASAIGVLRVDEQGNALNQAHFPCDCDTPESLDLGADGSIWFAEIFENRIGRLRPDPARPFSPTAVSLVHYNLPRQAEVFDPAAPGGVAMTALPLSVAVDGRERVWFSMSAMSAVAYLDPSKAIPNARTQANKEVGFTEFELPDSAFRSPAAPADITVDRANNLWWAGEYGDQIEQLRADGTQGHRFRGSVRRGLTEGPVVDARGNLWVVESGGNLVTRIAGVTDGVLRPFGLPAAFEADVTRDVVKGERLGDATSVEVRVIRVTTEVANATVPVRDGAFTISDSEWTGGADQIRAGDEVRIQLNGPHARAPITYRVASLSAAVQADGSLAGVAKAGGQVLTDRVSVTVGERAMSASVNGADGAWRIVPSPPLPSSTAGTIAWSAATVAGTFRTINRFTTPPAAAPPPPVSPAPPPAAAAPAAPPPAAAAPAAPPPAAAAPLAPATAAPARRSAACVKRHWLYGTRRRPRVFLLGLTTTQLRTCLGAPSATTSAPGRARLWRYGRGLRVVVRAGRVSAFTLLDASFAASLDDAGVGDSVTTLRRVLPGLRRDPRTNRQRALVTVDARTSADVQARVRQGRISSITVTLTRHSTLDAFGRKLLRGRA